MSAQLRILGRAPGARLGRYFCLLIAGPLFFPSLALAHGGGHCGGGGGHSCGHSSHCGSFSHFSYGSHSFTHCSRSHSAASSGCQASFVLHAGSPSVKINQFASSHLHSNTLGVSSMPSTMTGLSSNQAFTTNGEASPPGFQLETEATEKHRGIFGWLFHSKKHRLANDTLMIQ